MSMWRGPVRWLVGAACLSLGVAVAAGPELTTWLDPEPILKLRAQAAPPPAPLWSPDPAPGQAWPSRQAARAEAGAQERNLRPSSEQEPRADAADFELPEIVGFRGNPSARTPDLPSVLATRPPARRSAREEAQLSAAIAELRSAVADRVGESLPAAAPLPAGIQEDPAALEQALNARLESLSLRFRRPAPAPGW